MIWFVVVAAAAVAVFLVTVVDGRYLKWQSLIVGYGTSWVSRSSAAGVVVGSVPDLVPVAVLPVEVMTGLHQSRHVVPHQTSLPHTPSLCRYHC